MGTSGGSEVSALAPLLERADASGKRLDIYRLGVTEIGPRQGGLSARGPNFETIGGKSMVKTMVGNMVNDSFTLTSG